MIPRVLHALRDLLRDLGELLEEGHGGGTQQLRKRTAEEEKMGEGREVRSPVARVTAFA